MSDEISELRDSIDKIDRDIVENITKRLEISKKVAEIKYSSEGEDVEIYRKEREEEILKKIKSIVDEDNFYIGEDLYSLLDSIYSQIFYFSREEQKSFLSCEYGVNFNENKNH